MFCSLGIQSLWRFLTSYALMVSAISSVVLVVVMTEVIVFCLKFFAFVVSFLVEKASALKSFY